MHFGTEFFHIAPRTRKRFKRCSQKLERFLPPAAPPCPRAAPPPPPAPRASDAHPSPRPPRARPSAAPPAAHAAERARRMIIHFAFRGRSSIRLRPARECTDRLHGQAAPAASGGGRRVAGIRGDRGQRRAPSSSSARRHSTTVIDMARFAGASRVAANLHDHMHMNFHILIARGTAITCSAR